VGVVTNAVQRLEADDVVLVAHSGAGPLLLADGPVRLFTLYLSM
jgi:hypothetical protein